MSQESTLSFRTQYDRTLSVRPRAWVVNLLLVVSAAVLNPIFVALAAAYFESVRKIKIPLFFYAFVAYIFLGFWLREYGVNFSPEASDDVPEYFRRIGLEQFQSIKGVVSTFFLWPSGGEPIFYLVNLPISSLDTTIELFALYNYIPLAVLLSVALRLTMGSFSTLGALIFFFAVAEVSYAFIHLWRQAFAAVFILLSLYFIRRNKTAAAFLMLVLASLSHLLAAFFLFFYVLMFLPRLLLFRKTLPPSLVSAVSISAALSFLGFLMLSLGKTYDISSVPGMATSIKILALTTVSSLLYVFLVKTKNKTNDFRFMYYSMVSLSIIAFLSGPIMAHRALSILAAIFSVYCVLAIATLLSDRVAYLFLASASLMFIVRLRDYSQGAFHASYYNEFFSVFNPLLSVIGLA